MNRNSFLGRICDSPILRLTAVTLGLISLAFGGEIHDAAALGDLGKVKALLRDDLALVFNRDNTGSTPLHLAAFKGHRDVAEWLLANKADVNARMNAGATPL